MQETSSGKQNIVILVLLVFAACVIISGKFPDIVSKIDLNEQPEVLLRIKNDAI